MQLNEITRSHVRGQSPANLNLQSTLLHFSRLFHARDLHVQFADAASRNLRTRTIVQLPATVSR